MPPWGIKRIVNFFFFFNLPDRPTAQNSLEKVSINTELKNGLSGSHEPTAAATGPRASTNQALWVQMLNWATSLDYGLLKMTWINGSFGQSRNHQNKRILDNPKHNILSQISQIRPWFFDSVFIETFSRLFWAVGRWRNKKKDKSWMHQKAVGQSEKKTRIQWPGVQ